VGFQLVEAEGDAGQRQSGQQEPAAAAASHRRAFAFASGRAPSCLRTGEVPSTGRPSTVSIWSAVLKASSAISAHQGGGDGRGQAEQEARRQDEQLRGFAGKGRHGR